MCVCERERVSVCERGMEREIERERNRLEAPIGAWVYGSRLRVEGSRGRVSGLEFRG